MYLYIGTHYSKLYGERCFFLNSKPLIHHTAALPEAYFKNNLRGSDGYI